MDQLSIALKGPETRITCMSYNRHFNYCCINHLVFITAAESQYEHKNERHFADGGVTTGRFFHQN